MVLCNDEVKGVGRSCGIDRKINTKIKIYIPTSCDETRMSIKRAL